jgi:hypothetical protein
VKLNELLSHKSRLHQINERVREELKHTTGSSTLESELANLNQSWSDIVKKLSEWRMFLRCFVVHFKRYFNFGITARFEFTASYPL